MPEIADASQSHAAEPLLRVRGLSVRYDKARSLRNADSAVSHAAEDVSFDIARAETLGIVGESGSGKSTVARAVLGLVSPSTATVSGEIVFDGRPIWRNNVPVSASGVRAYRKQVGVVFQDPGGSLNPRMKVRDSIAEPLIVHGLEVDTHALVARVSDLLRAVELPVDAARRYPHEFSGGQRQRICIARAIALSPRLVVLDEPTSALDVSTQAQIINLLADLQRQRGLSYLFISHDIALVEHFCDRVAVMVRGRIIESGGRDAVFSSPREPYTQRLLAAAKHEPVGMTN